jgi:hypothetical protein
MATTQVFPTTTTFADGPYKGLYTPHYLINAGHTESTIKGYFQENCKKRQGTSIEELLSSYKEILAAREDKRKKDLEDRLARIKARRKELEEDPSKYNPRQDEVDANGHSTLPSILPFPNCCGVDVITGVMRTQYLRQFSEWHLKHDKTGGGMLVWAGTLDQKEDIKSLKEAGYKQIEYFLCRYHDKYPLVMYSFKLPHSKLKGKPFND